MTEALLSILSTFALIWLLVGIVGIIPMAMLRWMAFKPQDGSTARQAYDQAFHKVDPEWFAEQGFKRAGVLRVPLITVAGWQHDVEPIYIAATLTEQGVGIDIVTRWADGGCLTTSNTKAGAMIPPEPGTFVQVFSNADPKTLWDRHFEAEAALQSVHQRSPGETINFTSDFERSVKEQCGRIITRPWCWLAMPWWMTVRQHRWSNISVAEQIDRGWVNPQDISRST